MKNKNLFGFLNHYRAMNRKEFLKIAGASCVSLTAASALLSGCATTYSVTSSVVNDTLTLPKAEFIEIKKEERRTRDVVIIRAASLAFPIAVYRMDEDNYKALWMECTHQACEINAYSQYLTCPCHGSEFDAKGYVLQGPAESDLKTFNVTTDHENLYVHL